MSEMDILFSLPKGGRNVDDMGNPPDPIAAQPEWKCGNEFEPYHPQASHVSPDYRDGWNACYKIAIDALRRERERADEARDGWYMANGVADLATKHRDAAEADRDRLAAECERWRNVTARANPTDCAVGIKQLYDNWQQSQAEVERLTRECQTLRNVAVTADERAEKAEVERDALRADAERYRHIRPMFRAFSAHVDGMHSWCATGELARMKGPTFDAAIDAARKA